MSPINCAVCSKPLLQDFGDCIECTSCNNKYHLSICSGSETANMRLTKAQKQTWKCDICRTNKNKASTGSSESEQSTKKQQRKQEDDEDVQGNPKKYKLNESQSLRMIKSEIQADILEMKLETQRLMKELNENFLKAEKRIKDDITAVLFKLEDKVNLATAEVKKLSEKNVESENKILALEKRLNILEQKAMEKNIEIRNVPSKEREDLEEMFKLLATPAEITEIEKEVQDIYRPKKNSNNMIVKFRSVRIKRRFLANIKGKKINSSILKEYTKNDSPFQIYVGDQLTATNKRLLWQAKTRAKEFKWRFVWIRNGFVMAKKDEESQAFQILNEADLQIFESQ